MLNNYQKECVRLAAELKAFREQNFKSRQAAADACAISKGGFQYLEQYGNPQLYQLLKLTEGLDIKITIEGGKFKIEKP